MPVRIQRKRTRGWKAPEGTVFCTRSSKWQNPFRIGDPWPFDVLGHRYIVTWDSRDGPGTRTRADTRPMDRTDVICAYRQWIEVRLIRNPSLFEPLREVPYLACWCAVDEPCHVDVILEHLWRTRPTAADSTRPVFGVHVMPGDEAEGAPAWPSLGEVDSRRQERYNKWVRRN